MSQITIVFLLERTDLPYPTPPEAQVPIPEYYVFPGKLTLREAVVETAKAITANVWKTWVAPADVENGPSADDVPPTLDADQLLEIYEVVHNVHDVDIDHYDDERVQSEKDSL